MDRVSGRWSIDRRHRLELGGARPVSTASCGSWPRQPPCWLAHRHLLANRIIEPAAKAELEEISPSVTVDINADHRGSMQLRALAEKSDLFVMAWLSAKHAASDFIRDHCGAKPLLYSRGKGFSSTLRAIEDYITSSPQK